MNFLLSARLSVTQQELKLLGFVGVLQYISNTKITRNVTLHTFN